LNGALSTFEARAKAAIRAVPRGKVATYMQIAAVAGNDRAARQVARVLHSSSDRDRLPWHRIINSRGTISLPAGKGFEEQRRLLRRERVAVDRSGRIDLGKYQWEPGLSRQTRALDEFVRGLIENRAGSQRRRPSTS
jgi:methylated-DNA-protein-cysteine methyltransferase-like protein